MNYLRSLFLNFLVVFFVDRMIPGIQISQFEDVPNVGADILFSLIVGFLNASIFPFYAIMEIPFSVLKLAIISFFISFGAFTVIAFIPFGVQAVSFWGVLLGGFIVWGTACLCNYLEWVRDRG
jgi:uncharacterized membrane protein YvlD (DUF360 family)